MTTSLIRRISALLGAVVLLGVAVLAVPASSQTYGTSITCIELNEQDRTVLLEGDGFEPGTTINFFAEQNAVEVDTGVSTVAAADTSFGPIVVPVPGSFDITEIVVYIARGFRADGEQEVVSTDPLEQTTPPDDDTCVADDPGDGGDDGGDTDGGDTDGDTDGDTTGGDTTGGDDTSVQPDTVTPTDADVDADVESDLAFTGSSTMPMVTIAVGAIALGSIVLFGLRNRRTQS